MKPRLLDLYCCEGGAAQGYRQAGFHVTGVDVVDQPRYAGDDFVRADALDFLRRHDRDFDCVHASPPCQRFSKQTRQHAHLLDEHPDLIGPTRALLVKTGLPWVIENVPGAPLTDPVVLCGSMFGLRLLRHRLFETNFRLPRIPCRHKKGVKVVGVWGNTGGSSTRDGERHSKREWERAMGIDWMTAHGLTQAIPPAYAERVGHYLMRWLKEVGR